MKTGLAMAGLDGQVATPLTSIVRHRTTSYDIVQHRTTSYDIVRHRTVTHDICAMIVRGHVRHRREKSGTIPAS